MKQQKPYEKGTVLIDAPRHDNMAELVELAQDRQSWRATKHAIGSNKQCETPPSHQLGTFNVRRRAQAVRVRCGPGGSTAVAGMWGGGMRTRWGLARSL